MSEEKGVALSVHATQTPITGEEFAPPVTAESQIGVMRMSDEKRTFAMQALGDYAEADVASSRKARDFKDSTGLATTSRNQVRRLTPLECTRLQGFPDGWVDIGDWEDTKGRLHKEADAPKYKALGNSIAIPFWEWMARRMVAVLKRDGVEHPTMCSLFDGIGGFPLSFQRAGCDPVWASEIEEFPIAVTKRHFPEPSRPVSGEGRSTTRQAAENGYKAPLRAREAVLALNDQGGGAVMETSLEQVGTLRAADHGHAPAIIDGHSRAKGEAR